MLVIGILGSPRSRGNTALLLDAVLAGAREAGAETQRYDLAVAELNYCVGCSQCYRTGRCQYDDEVEAIKDAMLNADGIVLGSPVYLGGVTAQLKTVMDRCGMFVHCCALQGKYGAAVATAGGSEQDEIAAFQTGFLQRCAAYSVGTVAALGQHPRGLMNEDDELARATALGHDLAAAIREQRAYPDQDAAHRPLFEHMKALVTAWGPDYPAQYEHWSAKGWL